MTSDKTAVCAKFPAWQLVFSQQEFNVFFAIVDIPSENFSFYGDYRVYLEKYIVKKIIQIKNIYLNIISVFKVVITLSQKKIYITFSYVCLATPHLHPICENYSYFADSTTTTTHRSKFWPETDGRTDRQIYSQP